MNRPGFSIGHPASARTEPVHFATHVRAIIESTWAELAFAARHGGSQSPLMVQGSWTTARRIRSPDDWERFHALAGRVRDELIITPAERDIRESWMIR